MVGAGLVLGLVLSLSRPTHAVNPEVPDVSSYEKVKAQIKQTDPGMRKFFENAAGYVVFDDVGKGGLVVGGAHGTGIVFERGKPIGKASLSQVTVGAQVGGQSFQEVIFFETPEALARFKKGNFEFASQVSAVAIKAGASADANYEHGVLVFTQAKGGLMLEAAVGGQKFTFEPFGTTEKK
jgi:lipid-binding SYLF domain-containing protein